MMCRSLLGATRLLCGVAALLLADIGPARAQDSPIEYVSAQYLSSINVGRATKPGEKREPNALVVVADPMHPAEVRLAASVNDASIRKATGFQGSYPSPFVVTIDGARAIGEGYFAMAVHDGPNSFKVSVTVPAAQYGDRKFPAQTFSRNFTLNVIAFTLTTLARLPDDGWGWGDRNVYGGSGLEGDGQGDVFYIGNKKLSNALQQVTLRRLTPEGTAVTYQLSDKGDATDNGGDIRFPDGEVRVLGADPSGRLYVDVMHSLVLFDPAGKYLGTLGTMYAGDRPWKPQLTTGKPSVAPPSKTALLPAYLADRPKNAKWANTFLSTVWDPDTKSFVSLVANVDSRRYATSARPEVREPGHFLVRTALDGRMTLLATLHEPFRDDVNINERAPIFRDAEGRIGLVTDKEIWRWKQSLTKEPLPTISSPYGVTAFTQDGGVVASYHYLSPDQKVYAKLDLDRVQPVWGPDWRTKVRFRDIVTGRESSNRQTYDLSTPRSPAYPRWMSDGRWVAAYNDAMVAVYSMARYARSTSISGPVTEGPDFTKLAKDTPAAEPTLLVFPTASGSSGSIGLIPADENFPAIIAYQRGVEEAGVPVRFSLTAASGAQLRAGTSRGATVIAMTDEKGLARVRFHYMLSGDSRLAKPQEFVVLVEDAGRASKVTVRVGLGLIFDRASYLKGSFKLGTYPLPLSIKSSFFPSLDVGLYLFNADKSGAWQGKTPGFQLAVEHQNTTSGNRGVFAHKGTGHLARVENSTLLLTDGEPRYYMTKWELPAVEIKESGTYVYRVNAKLCVLDVSQHCIADNWAEGMIPPALITIVTEAPEAWYQSLACSFEAKDIVQYAMFETAKMFPVYGQAVDAFGTATSLTCKLLQGDYESAFYDLGTVLGGKYLDHLQEPAVYAKLTSQQQAALDLAKAAYDKLDEYAKSEQRKALIKNTARDAGLAQGQGKTDIPADSTSEKEQMRESAARSPAPQPSAVPVQRSSSAPDNSANVKNAAKDNVNERIKNEAQKILKDVFKGIFK